MEKMLAGLSPRRYPPRPLAAAVKEVFDHPVIGRCQIHQLRNAADHLPDKMRGLVTKRMRGAYHAESAVQAEAMLQALAKELDKAHLGTAGSLREGLAETLTVLRLDVPPTLARTLRSKCDRVDDFDQQRARQERSTPGAAGLADVAGLLHDAQKHGWSVATTDTAGLDMATPTGRLIAGVLASDAAFERDLIRGGTKALVAKRAQGIRRPQRLPVSTVERIVTLRPRASHYAASPPDSTRKTCRRRAWV